MNLPAYRKTIAAVVGAVLTWGLTAQADGIDGVEWWGLAVALATALGVYGTTNEQVDPDAGESTPEFIVRVTMAIVFVIFAYWLIVKLLADTR